MKISINNPAIKSLEVLIGEWEIELSNTSFLPNKSDTVKGLSNFDVTENSGFLVERQGDVPLPWARWIMGRDDSEQTYSVLYFDDRGFSRLYQMSFSNNVWKKWRRAPGFWQRFEGKISNDGNTINAYWEQSNDDGHTWKNDFDITYRRK
ncbi:hypothetical protein I6I99_09670 [Sphingobacterium multivorum]|nr:hypothetical protein [Sphingobacterium multivorum]QQT32800.1 hypothetical protein I6I99_09670 [Sphingobacterium multivorum]